MTIFIWRVVIEDNYHKQLHESTGNSAKYASVKF